MLLHGGSKPNKTEGPKDENYHLQMARFFCHDGFNDSRHSKWIEKTKKAKAFYRGDQWIDEEDLAIFFQDKHGNPTHRVKLTFNTIRPIVETYRGSALNMGFNGTVYSVGTESYKRKLNAHRKIMFMDRIARAYGGSFMEAIGNNAPLGRSPQETESNFEDLYVDDYTVTMNNYLQNVMKRNNADRIAIKLAESCAFSGAAIAKPYIQGGHWTFRYVPSELFAFDRSCIMDDTSDAEYWLEINPVNVTTLAEAYPLIDSDTLKAMEQSSNLFADSLTTRGEPFGFQQSGHTYSKGRVPIHKAVWVDVAMSKYAYVETEDGRVVLERVYKNKEEAGDDGSQKYYEKDALPLEKLSPGQKRILKNKKILSIKHEQLRFCDFVPAEFVTGGMKKGFSKASDIVLEYGPYSMEERDPIDPRRVRAPYKVGLWSYVDGIITGPIDDIIDPQRFINRVMSVTENKINTAPSDFVAYDKRSANADADGERNLLAAMSGGGAVGIDSRSLGLPNVIMPVAANTSQSSLGMLSVVNSLTGFIQHTTGVNGPMTGGQAQRDQLVGVTEALIERGNLLQMPFFNVIAQVYLGLYNSAVTDGAAVYAENEQVLVDMVGDPGANIIKMTKGIALEGWACSIRMDAAEHLIRQSADNLLTTLLQLQIIDREMFAELFGKSTPDSIAAFLRSRIRAERVAAREMANAEEVQAEAILQQSEAANRDQDRKVNDQRNFELKKNAQNIDGAIKKDIMKAAVKESFAKK